MLPNNGMTMARKASLCASLLKIIDFFITYLTATYAPSQSAKILASRTSTNKTAGILTNCATPARAIKKTKKISAESKIVVSHKVVQIQN